MCKLTSNDLAPLFKDLIRKYGVEKGIRMYNALYHCLT